MKHKKQPKHHVQHNGHDHDTHLSNLYRHFARDLSRQGIDQVKRSTAKTNERSTQATAPRKSIVREPNETQRHPIVDHVGHQQKHAGFREAHGQRGEDGDTLVVVLVGQRNGVVVVFGHWAQCRQTSGQHQQPARATDAKTPKQVRETFGAFDLP